MDKLGEGFVVLVIGLLVVFSVLLILWFIIAIFKVVFYDIPNKKKSNTKNAPIAEQINTSSVETPVLEDDCEIVAVISAAVASMLQTSTGNFRIKSIKRVSKWNKN